MNILVVLRMVPDVVEELEIAPEGKSLDFDVMRMVVSESDDHALEEALLLKERHSGQVTVIAPDAAEVNDALFTALAKGADRAVKLTGLDQGLSTRSTAQLVGQAISGGLGLQPADLILTGVQAIDDLDGLMAPLIAHHLNLPHLGIVTKVTVAAGGKSATAIREYQGGVRGEFELPLPAVLGIQAAEKPPRYVPVAKVRAAMKSQKIETAPAPAGPAPPSLDVIEMKKPEPASHAEMIEGDPDQASARLLEILSTRGVL